MPTTDEQLRAMDKRLARVEGIARAIQGQPASALISIPHNDSWLFEDNVDGAGGFPGNLRYVIASNVQRVVSANLSIHRAPYRTYNSLSFSVTGSALGNHSHSHNHGGGSHGHTIPFAAGPFSNAVGWDGGNMKVGGGGTSSAINSSGVSTDVDATTANLAHTHSISGSTVLGITEGAVPTGIALSFDGVDRTAALGGPFNADLIELDILQYLPVTTGVFHVVAMTPTGLGRLEAHLRLGVYVSAGSVF